MSGGLLTAAIRVLARAAAIQIEEAATRSAIAGPSRSGKGKEREVVRSPLSESIRTENLSAYAGDESRHQSRTSEPFHLTSPAQPILSYGQNTTSTRKHLERLPAEGSASGKVILAAHDETSLSSPSYLPRSPTTGATPASSTIESEPSKMPTTPLNPAHNENEAPPDTGNPDQKAPLAEVEPMVTNAVESRDADTSSVPGALPGDLGSHIKDQEQEEDEKPVMMRASKVPSSRLGRLFHYGSLAASMSYGAASESLRRSTGSGGTGSVFMSDANIRRLVGTLGQMRGAALKLGQFMSIQDNNMLPPEIEKVLQQVQANANYMPDWQMEKVMSAELGNEWESLFSTFNRTPIASASIGQVHRATLASTGEEVAIKIQFPGVSSSIASDLANLSLLLRSSALLPKGLYLQNTIAVMRRELEDECDYIREAESGRKFRDLLKDDKVFVVPKVMDEASTNSVLTTEWMDGKPLSRMKGMSQATRNSIGTSILRLCLKELFQFRFMQTDPNWANFLYSSSTSRIQLIDFGASREYTKQFMDGWYRLLVSALTNDKVGMKRESLALGYLTGEEEQVMLDAHLRSMELVASPFNHEGGYDFSHQTITEDVRKLIPVMLKYRLTPPPSETYSLNRKLSGAFLMCAKLGAVVDCERLWEEEVGNYQTE